VAGGVVIDEVGARWEPSSSIALLPKTLAAATVDRLLHHAHALLSDIPPAELETLSSSSQSTRSPSIPARLSVRHADSRDVSRRLTPIARGDPLAGAPASCARSFTAVPELPHKLLSDRWATADVPYSVQGAAHR